MRNILIYELVLLILLALASVLQAQFGDPLPICPPFCDGKCGFGCSGGCPGGPGCCPSNPGGTCVRTIILNSDRYLTLP